MESGNLRTLIRKFKLIIFNKIAPKCYFSFVFVYICFRKCSLTELFCGTGTVGGELVASGSTVNFTPVGQT